MCVMLSDKLECICMPEKKEILIKIMVIAIIIIFIITRICHLLVSSNVFVFA